MTLERNVSARCSLVGPALLATLAGAPASAAFPPAFGLTAIDGSNGYVVFGVDPHDHAGRSVSSAGDVNGDGIDDIIIGARDADYGTKQSVGEAYVVFCGATVGATGSFDLASLDGTNGFVFRSLQGSDWCGTSVSFAGDVNDDGFDDVIIGATGVGQGGQCYVVFGGPTVGAAGVLTRVSLNGATGFIIDPAGADDNLGRSVSAAGDVNGDGVADLIIGANYADTDTVSNPGRAFVVFGGPSVGASGSLELSTLDGTNGFAINGIAPADWTGISVAGAGDVNGDRMVDLIIGARFANSNGQASAGKSYLVFGGPTVGTSGSLDLSSLNGANGCVFNGEAASDYSGISVSSAGDVNGDGTADVVIGAFRADPAGQSWAGRSYVVFGSPTVGGTGSIDLSTLNGANGFMLNGIDTWDRSGVSVSSAGDFNGDGIDDVLIGAYYGNAIGPPESGQAYIVFGDHFIGASGTINLSSLNGTNGFAIDGATYEESIGISVSRAGDVNGDGMDDIIIGSKYGDAPGRVNAGTTYVVFGRTPPPPACPGDINDSGGTNISDFNILAGNFGAGPAATRAEGDLSGDGLVNIADFNILAGDFGCVTAPERR